MTRSAAVSNCGSCSHGSARPCQRSASCSAALEAAIDHGHVVRAFVLQVAQRLLAHFAGADHQHVLVVESLEDLAGEIADRHAGNADAPLVQRGFGGHALGHADRGLKDAVRQRAGALAVLGQLVGLLDLRQDLRLADHHAVETGRHGEQVPHGVFARPLEQVVEDFVHRQPVKVGHELRDFLVAGTRLGVFGGRVDLHAVAGREQHGLGLRKALRAGRRAPGRPGRG